jgi:hypothetical protein
MNALARRLRKLETKLVPPVDLKGIRCRNHIVTLPTSCRTDETKGILVGRRKPNGNFGRG